MAFYPEGIQAQSPGLRGTSYPGSAVLVVPTPTGLWRARPVVGHNPVGVEPISLPAFPGQLVPRNPGLEGAIPSGLTIGGNQPPLADPNFPAEPQKAAKSHLIF